jgi:hypothetical protein
VALTVEEAPAPIVEGFVRATKLRLSTALACGFLAGCSPNHRPHTVAFVHGYETISDDLNGQIRQGVAINAPHRPLLPQRPTPDQRLWFVGAQRYYANALIQYHGKIIERCQVLSQLNEQTQMRIAALKTSGVDRGAVRVIKLREQVLARYREFFIGTGQLAELNRAALIRRKSSDEWDEILNGVFRDAFEGSAIPRPEAATVGTLLDGLKGAGDLAAKRPAEKSLIGEQIARILAAGAQLKRESADYETAYAELATTLTATSPEENWHFKASERPGGVQP